ncbi:class I SAM-dependent methyltransferase [Methylocystis sp. B8]|uniref:class I SAM-dependent methyltransferase n=1 Tax=Methylocystis sp. B8 TaxID=544938 RepID=UPI001485813A|nr:class I SAM-dependent methyltransferase [Methylocystis sp. B8]
MSAADRDSVERSIKHCYSTWGTSYYADYYGADAPYPPVHLDLVSRLVAERDVKRLLDAGCGPASMLRHLVAPGRDIYGFDLTPEMVVEARRVLAEQGVPADHVWEGSVAVRADFVAPTGNADYDCVLCSGVMPHIAETTETDIIANIRDALQPGGHAIVEARNELFSMFTLNRYSHEFFLKQLLPVDELRRQAGDEGDGMNAALAQVERMFRTDVPPIRQGKDDEPGYDEVLSRTHNPLLLQQKFLATGFTNVQLYYYHFHCLPPVVSGHAPRLFREISLQMEANPKDWRGLFMASAFFVVAQRA